MTALLQIVFDAMSLGSLYAMGALGIALIFGVMRLVNFAHGDFIAFCVFALLWPSIDATAILFAGLLPTYLLVPLILLVGAGLSVFSEIVVFRRFRNANPATMMITSFALGFVIRYVLLMLYSSRPKSIDLWPALSLPVDILGAHIPLLQVVTIGVTIVMAALTIVSEAHPLRAGDARGGRQFHDGADARRARQPSSSCSPSRSAACLRRRSG